MIIYLASDHAGYELKNGVKEYLNSEQKFEVEDLGAYILDVEDDYPDFISEAAKRVSARPQEARAIIFGGSGQGEAMLANRYSNVRATTYYDHNLDIIRLSRQHNDANVLSIGARFIDLPEAIEAIEVWFDTVPSTDEKYMRRVKKAERLSLRE